MNGSWTAALAAAAPAPGTLFRQVWPWLAGLAGVVVAGAVAIWLIRRWLGRAPASGDAGFSLQQLRDLHARGQLTDEEFQRAKASIIGRMSRPNTSAAPARACKSPESVEPLDPGDEAR